jgi:hypothetical protein
MEPALAEAKSRQAGIFPARGRVVQRTAFALAAASLLVVIGTLASVRGTWSGDTSGPPDPRYAPGQHVDVPPAVYSSTPYTLLFFGTSTCAACQRSEPAIETLTAEFSADPQTRLAVVGSAASPESGADFARRVGLESRLVQLDFSSLRVKYVPTTLLATRTGEILFAREGVLTRADVQAIRHVLRSPAIPR